MESWLALATFAFVSSITPGPNNAMLSASGVVFGFRRTLPHLFGVWAGFALLLVLCGAGLGGLLERWPMLAAALKLSGSIYLLYFAWTLRRVFENRAHDATGRPMRFHEAVAFQFVNPKAWVMGVTAVAVFAPDLEPAWLAVAALCAVFALVNLPCICSWTALGATLKPWLSSVRNRKLLGAALALLMCWSVVVIWI